VRGSVISFVQVKGCQPEQETRNGKGGGVRWWSSRAGLVQISSGARGTFTLEQVVSSLKKS